jgi:hypothetical protein
MTSTEIAATLLALTPISPTFTIISMKMTTLNLKMGILQKQMSDFLYATPLWTSLYPTIQRSENLTT